MQVLIGKYSGYCPGVKRAIKMLDNAIDGNEKNNIYTFGEIIHNPKVVKSYLSKGVGIARETDKLSHNDTVVIRSHGISPKLKKEFEDKGVNIIDATCPFVSKAQRIAKSLSDKDYFIVLIGEKNHPEVNGITSNIKTGEFLIAGNEAEIKNLRYKNKIAVLSQTTQTYSNFKLICQKLIDTFPYEIRIFKTICRTTYLRQKEVLKMASSNNAVIVVGGKNSANTCHLKELAVSVQKNTYHVEDEREVKKNWFRINDKVAVIGGASTPYQDLCNVKKRIESFF
ncbi:MAG: 4-hydroxy-3-methylbut-2-enyl diphosphate reductase [Actinomycetota bacterium]|nr:4-hydroxy-3-methylbut-2-enyl diphosphate reductase [Actinomycetota bacterium]